MAPMLPRRAVVPRIAGKCAQRGRVDEPSAIGIRPEPAAASKSPPGAGARADGSGDGTEAAGVIGVQAFLALGAGNGCGAVKRLRARGRGGCGMCQFGEFEKSLNHEGAARPYSHSSRS
jgi:hypothetical protein